MNTFTENTVLSTIIRNLKATVKEDVEDARKGSKTTSDDRRCRLLAYTFLKGRTYLQVEANPRYLRAGFYVYDESLQYERSRLIKKIASFIPEDLGDGVSRATMLDHIRVWLEVGAVTRNQIMADRAGIMATRDKMTALGVAQSGVKEWDAKVARITRDMEHAKSTGAEHARIARYEADLLYTSAGRDKAHAKLVEAQAALDAVKDPVADAVAGAA